METIFTIKKEHLFLLSAEQAVDFFQNLIWAEAVRVGIPLHDINVSSYVNTADGGVDASVRENTSLITSSIIKMGRNSYQIKTGDSFKPWQKSQIKDELFGKKGVKKENLSEMVRRCLDKNGCYVLVCFGHDLIDQQREETIKNIRELLADCDYIDSKVDVWSANNLISFIHFFPALSLRANGREKALFETHEEWSRHDDMSSNFIVGEEQEKIISGIQAELRSTDKPVHIRICGEPGIGKTRLILNATEADDLKPLVIYSYTSGFSGFRDSNLMNEILRGDFSAILVLDECDAENRAYIWNRFKHLSSNIKIISIYNEYESTSGVIYFEIPPLNEQQTTAIIEGYGVPKDRAYIWARECSGSPRVAHVIGSNLINHPDDVFKSPGTINIWDRYISGPDQLNSPEVQTRKLVLQYLSLFKRFGYGRLVVSDSQAIAEIIRAADPSVTWQKFQTIIKGLRNRKILQGENTLYITPKLLHIKLWIDWWEMFGDGFDITIFFSLPTTLPDWFYEMFEYAAGSEAASHIVKDLLGENGPFQQNPELMRSGRAARFFRFLAISEPGSGLRCLKQTLGRWNKEELLELTAGRREIIWALEEMARWRDLFADSARLLLALGEAENESYSNNASGVFSELFAIRPHMQLAQTEASPKERFPIIVEALTSASKKRRYLGLAACEQVLTPMTGGPIKDRPRIVGKEPELWMPKTYGEIFDAYRQSWEYLLGHIDSNHEDERQKATDIILQSIRSLVRYEALHDLMINMLKNLSKKPDLDRGKTIEVVTQVLHYHGKHFPTEKRSLWLSLQEEVTGSDFHSLLNRYVGMNLIEDNFDEEGNSVDIAQKKIDQLSEMAIKNRVDFYKELNWILTDAAKNGYPFGYSLAKVDSEVSFLPHIVETLETMPHPMSTLFLGGYLRALFEQDKNLWDKTINEFASQEKLAPLVPDLIWRSGKLSDKYASLILNLIRKNIVGIETLQRFIYGGSIKNASLKAFKGWVNFLLSHHEPVAAYIAVEIYFYYFRENSNHKLPEELTFQVIANPRLFQQNEVVHYNQMITYYWELLGKGFLRSFPSRALDLASIILENFGGAGSIFNDTDRKVGSLLEDIIREDPRGAWIEITKYLGPPIDARSFSLSHWLRGKDNFDSEEEGALSLIPPEVVWQWVEDDVEERAWYLASFVPKVLTHEKENGEICWAREVLVKYGERDDVRRNLWANFSTEGWWGSEAAHYQAKKDRLLDFYKTETNENVKSWIQDYVAQLDINIERAKVIEERED